MGVFVCVTTWDYELPQRDSDSVIVNQFHTPEKKKIKIGKS